MSAGVPIIRQGGEGELMWFAGGGVITWKATAEETGGAFLLFEDRMPQGKVTPLHIHPEEDELIYVLDGELIAHADGEEHSVGAGGVFFAPRGYPHAFMVTSESARILALQTPGSGERFYRDAGAPVASLEDDRGPDFKLLGEVAGRSPSIEILGPPPFAVAAGQPG